MEKIKKLRNIANSYPEIAEMLRTESKAGMAALEAGTILEVESLLFYALNCKSKDEMVKLLRKTLTRFEGQPGLDKKVLAPVLKRARAALRSGGSKFE